jgi:putative ABC transport system permease protein
MHSPVERMMKIGRALASAFYRSGGGPVYIPLARRNLLADKRRLLLSTSGIAFAVLLMMIQIGFRGAFLDSALEIIQKIEADIFLTSSTKFRFGRKDSFSYRQLFAARAVDGIESVRPIYGEWMVSSWKNPQTRKIYTTQVLAFDPAQPVFMFPEVAAHLSELQEADTALFDQRSRRFVGSASAGTVTELARHQIRVVGTFSLGPDFTTDGTVLMSDRNFLKFFPPKGVAGGALADVEFGIVKVRPGYSVEAVQRALQRALPASVAVRTKAQQVAHEAAFQVGASPVGPIFMLGAAIGFIVGMMISYQILYTDLSDQLSQYATLKAMGYRNGYLVRVVLQQAGFYALVSFLPAWAVGVVAFRFIREFAILPMHMSVGIVLGTLSLTLGMCMLSGILAVRRVLAADPAELFR